MNQNYDKTAYLLKCLMDNTPDHIYFKDLDSRFILRNDTVAHWRGKCASNDMIGKSDFDVFSREHAERAYADEQRIIETGEGVRGQEEKETWPDGTVSWVSTTKMPLRNERGEIIGTFGVSRDITEHKETELRAARYAEEVRHYAEEVRRVKEEMEDDLRLAGELQKAFFPVSYPVFLNGAPSSKPPVQFHHHIHAGGLIGGDFCSIRKLSDSEAGIFLCDVMGHGVRAALGTAIIRTLVDDLSRSEKDPGQYLERMNQALIPILRSTDEFIFVTACYMVLDLSTLQVRFADAGHPAPVCLGADGRVELCLADSDARGPALAVMEEASYQTRALQLHPGDAVVMFTDGIYEIAGRNHEEYGEQRLLESFRRNRELPLPALFPTVLNEARRFADDSAFDDDVCLVGFRLRQ